MANDDTNGRRTGDRMSGVTEERSLPELREEIEELESRIEELTEFKTGREYHTQSRAE